jgi:hypothetical protein
MDLKALPHFRRRLWRVRQRPHSASFRRVAMRAVLGVKAKYLAQAVNRRVVEMMLSAR